MSNLADLFARCGPVALASTLSPEAVARAVAERRAMRVKFSPDIITIDPSVYASLDLKGEPPHLVFAVPIPDELRFVDDEVRELEDHVTAIVIHFVKRPASDPPVPPPLVLARNPPEWLALPESLRVQILEALRALASAREDDERRRGMCSTWGGGEVEVLGLQGDAARCTVQFYFDYVVSHLAQSGSDWANHYAFLGTAEFAGGVIGKTSEKVVDDQFIRESEESDYDPAGFRLETIARVLAGG